MVVRDAKRDVEDTFLNICQVHQSRQQQWTHLCDSGAHWMALFSQQIPESHGKGAILQIKSNGLRTFGEGLMQFAQRITRCSKSREIAFDIRHEHRDTRRR